MHRQGVRPWPRVPKFGPGGMPWVLSQKSLHTKKEGKKMDMKKMVLDIVVMAIGVAIGLYVYNEYMAKKD